MHEGYIPHCSYCEHFVSCFYSDMVTEWGYCSLAVGDKAPSREETDAIKGEVKAGNYEKLRALQEQEILFVPTEVNCADFIDLYPE